jgi:hypothetical protein
MKLSRGNQILLVLLVVLKEVKELFACQMVLKLLFEFNFEVSE